MKQVHRDGNKGIHDGYMGVIQKSDYKAFLKGCPKLNTQLLSGIIT